MGPPLTNLAEHWTREELAQFLRSPTEFVARIPRLGQLSRKFRTPMVGNHVLGSQDRLRLADWLLELDPGE